jgi:hypothetical protein
MTFEEILDQALAMLQRRGRVTYRTLQRQFDLDEAALADLKDAIRFAHPQVIDEAGQGLVWPASPTYRLIQGYFACREFGAQALRGVAQPLAVYQVLQESGAPSRLEVAQSRGLTPLVGRDAEVTVLLERWEHAKQGHGQVVLLTGEGGMGKSRLVHVVQEQVANEPHIQWAGILPSIGRHNARDRKLLRRLWQSCLNWQSNNPCSLSWKICTGRIPPPWSFWGC